MTGRAPLFEPWEGGRYRIELSYPDEPGAGGKTGPRSDVSHGIFLEVDPGRRIVQSAEFESGDPAFAGEMILTWSFRDTGEGAEVTVSASNVPPGISEADHQAGLASSLANLARFVERDQQGAER